MRAQVVIRIANSPKARASVAELVREYREWDLRVSAEHGYDPSLVAQVIYPEEQHDDDPSTTVFLAYMNRAPAGCGMLKQLGGASAEIKRLYVRPAYRGFGIGSKILSKLIALARAAEIECVRLETATFMTDAVALYQRAGFRIVDTDVRNAIGLRDVAIFMEKHLSDSI